MIYTIEPACDTVETGKVFPQIQKFSPKYNRHQKDSIYSFLKEYHKTNDIPPEIPNLDSFFMQGNAKPSDMVSNSLIGNHGLFVSEKLKVILQEFDLPSHRFYPSKVLHKGEILSNYFWFFFIPTSITNVDFGRSSFFIYRSFLYNEGAIELNSVEDYLYKKQLIKEQNPGINITIWANKIVFKKDYKVNALFEIGSFDSQIYINSDLRERIQEQSITGCKIVETDKIVTI